ncbi:MULTISPECIES: cysteine desulfurase sulfur acceptor subunit CsdE [Proteus]|uniref:Cysteine desulfurase, sulfur acceptor subunit CsdE n=1 Tax=Proteus mirabilis TaxID=584 RepID=A0AAJ1DG39_PROMI|nr:MULTISPECIES: cysteine desulfurase sulfur acceptor subunit CsdE [Proteus]ARX33747.1 cysteine desulfurase, sulfur acceptor subunit CsdE [Proteus mirabilis]EJD6315613.1 cysteine desulfurase sulfur acceptor subunit CsdE [Proteus mirabilis]EJD6319713.1 cysteine desulfurase sulfur acceptor subunit CsdE [Proteus mirabilis]EJD6439887.1 cysteine desulfurase sulfur acceptor subunit CsdE [Proteus mirabilis]EJD6526657.1 cysteine desulfurase sulfur acceptor subunit CsdE [Proteus mirabilis]
MSNNTQHPFGHDITLDGLFQDFQKSKSWEDKYRQLIQLSRKLPALPNELKTTENEIKGCENRVWLGVELNNDGKYHIYGDSDGRIVKGLLAVILTTVENKTAQEIANIDILAIFEQLGLANQISQSRTDGVNAIIARLTSLTQTSQP